MASVNVATIAQRPRKLGISGMVDARQGGSWLIPSPVLGDQRYHPPEIFENIGADLLQFGACWSWIRILNRNIQTFTSYQLVYYHLPQTLANYLVLDLIGDQWNRKCTTRFILILVDQFDDIRSSKVGKKIDAFPSHFWMELTIMYSCIASVARGLKRMAWSEGRWPPSVVLHSKPGEFSVPLPGWHRRVYYCNYVTIIIILSPLSRDSVLRVILFMLARYQVHCVLLCLYNISHSPFICARTLLAHD